MNIQILSILASMLCCILWARPVLSQTVPVPPDVNSPATITPQAGVKTSPATATQNQPGATELRIAAGDLLGVTLFGTDFSCNTDKTGCEVRVSDSGAVVLPLIGEVKVGRLTVEQAAKVIGNKFSAGGFYNDPQVIVVQKEYATQGISVLGEVQKPGIYPLLGSHTLLQAISAAGGTTAKAGNDVKVIHASRLNDPERADLSSSASSSVTLLPGDTIIVSKAGIVYVVGDVKQPTGIVMENSGLTVLKAIAMAQGTNPTAKLNNAKLIRNGPEGHVEIPISLTKILSNKEQDLPLRAEDVLFIPNSAAKSAARRSVEAILQTATGLAIYGRY